MATRTELVVVLFSRGGPYHAEACADPGGFVVRRKAALDRLAAERMSRERMFVTARGTWALILPDTDPTVLLPTIEAVYDREVAATLARQIGQFPDAVIAWTGVHVVGKGFDSDEVRRAS